MGVRGRLVLGSTVLWFYCSDRIAIAVAVYGCITINSIGIFIMPAKTVSLPLPSPDLVASYVQQFDQTQAVVERTLSQLFQQFPENKRLEDVLLKVVVLNDLYRTGILATYKVAEHIFDRNIDERIRQGEVEAIELIARVSLGNGVRNNYSFATKYCAWHNSSAFPIYDSFVDKMLWGYQKQDRFDVFHRQDLWKYERFKATITHFRNHYALLSFELRDIDKFLWLAGQKYYPASWAQSSTGIAV
jgi:hypothetical protein